MGKVVLLTGGAGYIGSHMVKILKNAGHETVVFDNLSTGHRDAVISAAFYKGDLKNPEEITNVLSKVDCDLVMHFAGSCYVGESMVDPGKYWNNNLVGTINLLEAMRSANVANLVFSSSCSTYGIPASEIITEEHPQRPINTYGMTKYAAEQAMHDYGLNYGINTVSLRYFNAAGCDPDGDLGERHDPETHLIPLVLQEALRVKNGGDPAATELRIFGLDFETPDGTCIRDYVHVTDLCVAHLQAMHRLSSGVVNGFEAFNLGNGHGYSVKEVIESCRRVTGQDIQYRPAGRRPGDPERLVASADKAAQVLGWRPTISALDEIIETAWKWFLAESMRSVKKE